MSDYKAEIERRIENLKATREVAGSRFDKHTIKGYTAKIEMLEDILETVANGVGKSTEPALHKHIVSGSVCNRCKNRGWTLPSDGKILVTERYDALSGLMMPEPAYVQESERMIKCDCGR